MRSGFLGLKDSGQEDLQTNQNQNDAAEDICFAAEAFS
jgi:hypothetical protein